VSLELTDLGYVEDGDNLVTLAMNGWGDADPWWLNGHTYQLFAFEGCPPRIDAGGRWRQTEP
jgi:hypothetical protein